MSALNFGGFGRLQIFQESSGLLDFAQLFLQQDGITHTSLPHEVLNIFMRFLSVAMLLRPISDLFRGSFVEEARIALSLLHHFPKIFLLLDAGLDLRKCAKPPDRSQRVAIEVSLT